MTPTSSTTFTIDHVAPNFWQVIIVLILYLIKPLKFIGCEKLCPKMGKNRAFFIPIKVKRQRERLTSHPLPIRA